MYEESVIYTIYSGIRCIWYRYSVYDWVVNVYISHPEKTTINEFSHIDLYQHTPNTQKRHTAQKIASQTC